MNRARRKRPGGGKKQRTRQEYVYLLKKGQKGIVHAIFSRFGLILLLLILQGMILMGLFEFLAEDIVPYFYGGTALFDLLGMLYLINCRMDGTSKLTWAVIIGSMPVIGALFFYISQLDPMRRREKAALQAQNEAAIQLMPQNEAALAALREKDPGAAGLASYIGNGRPYPVYEGTLVQYFPLGEDKWAEMLNELEKAEKFIFMEYFIIDEGAMWGSILNILREKAKAGVDVRVMYDGTCELSTLSHDYPRRMREIGIQCKMFAPVRAFPSTHYNYRDHRKILVIDGKVGFTGGVNLADEYVNRIVRFGHWKDTAVMLRGDAVRSLTSMFLQMWNISDPKAHDDSIYLAKQAPITQHVQGYVVPYGINPLAKDRIGEWVYMDILNRATRYVYIMTPYLVLSEKMLTALCFAAQRGVDVRLILPGIPDKKIPYALAKTNYAVLTEAGVKVFEYTPGFVHAKLFVSDDREAVVGTINLDYRSLYHHFECAVYMHDVKCIPQITADFLQTQEKCRSVTKATIRHESPITKLTGVLLKIIGPML